MIGRREANVNNLVQNHRILELDIIVPSGKVYGLKETSLLSNEVVTL